MKHFPSLSPLSGAHQPLKKLLVAGALILSSLVAGGARAQANEADALALQQARDRMLIGATLLQQRSFGYDGVTPFSMAFINRGGYSSIRTPLQAGVTYAIIGVGDDDVRDIDVIVQDGAGNLIAQDVDDKATAVATFTPRYGGTYTIFLKLHRSDDYASACALSIFRKSGGYKLAPESVRQTTDNMFALALAAYQRFSTIYHHGTGQWAIVGSILNPGVRSTFSGIATREGHNAFIAVGDEYMQDLDMKVRDVNGTVQIIDDDSDASAVCARVFNSRQTCSIELINARSNGYSLVLHAVLHR